MIEAVLEEVAVTSKGQAFVLIIKTAQEQRFTIFIGPLEAQSILLGRGDLPAIKRPLTHDLLLSMLEIMGASIKRIEITDLKEGTYYAQIVLEHRGLEYEIDARPSDALALASRVEAPLLVAEKVVDEAAVEVETDELSGGAEA